MLPGTTLDHGFAARGLDLDFYSMPRAHEFTGFEDGAVGYNFLTVSGSTSVEERQLACTIAMAAKEIQTLGTGSPPGNAG